MAIDSSIIEAELHAMPDIHWEKEPCRSVLDRWAIELRRSEPKDLIALFQRWMASPEFLLHMAVPHLYAKMASPDEELGLWVLNAGIDYPDPSYNRYFIQAAIRHLGLERVLLHLTDHFDRERDAVHG